MNKIERLGVFPYDMHFTPLLRHRSMLAGYQISGICSPGGWGLCGKDAGDADGGDPLLLNVDSDFDKLLDSCETVLFTQSNIKPDVKKMLYHRLLSAIDRGKNIICTIDLEDGLISEISERCKLRDVYFKYISKSTFTLDIDADIEAFGLCKIHTPVVYVLGVGENTHKFEIQLSLREKLTCMGYKVSQIGSRNYCELLGFHSFPSFMLDCHITETAKVILFNHFIRKIEMDESPDIIIVGIPGGIMAFNDTLTNRFGILAYEVSQAVEPDAAVFSLLYDDFKPIYFTQLATSLKHRLACDVSCYNISDIRFDWAKASTNGSMHYITVDSRLVDQKKENFRCLDIPVYNILNCSDADNMAECIVNKLSYYNEVKSV